MKLDQDLLAILAHLLAENVQLKAEIKRLKDQAEALTIDLHLAGK